MNSRQKGIAIALIAGVAAATVAYLSLSETDRQDLLEESNEKIGELNDTIKDLSERFLGTVTEKLEDSKSKIDQYSDFASTKFEDSLSKAKGTIDHYSDLAGDKIDEQLNHFKNK
ncbi:Protein essC [Streptococcus porcinus]|uniref:Protein essC n=2 Tax=Streptococcus porcinus TaxID=1340 RepID=A0A4V0H6X5_STRPO|nr:Protein essC [Streptococcus porcinus]VTT45004.1 Protein essC [Streptococcus porcinus]